MVVEGGVDEAVTVAQGFYDLLARYLPGDTTLNELRVLTAVAVTGAVAMEGEERAAVVREDREMVAVARVPRSNAPSTTCPRV